MRGIVVNRPGRGYWTEDRTLNIKSANSRTTAACRALAAILNHDNETDTTFSNVFSDEFFIALTD
jgi:hypothetical protein